MTRRIARAKPTANELQESEARYRQLFEAHPHPMWVYDLATLRFLAVNDAAIAKYAYTRDEFLALRITDIRPAEEVPGVLHAVRTLGPGVRNAGIWQHRTKGGELLSVEISTHPVEFSGRQAILVQALDVTARLAAEAELAVERERLEAAQRVAKVGNWETDLLTLTVIWSSETYRIFGLDPARFVPTHETFLERVHPADREKVDAAFRASFATRDVCTVTHRLVMPDGSLKQVEERWRTFVDSDGRPWRAAGTTQDITERAEAAAALEEGQSLLRVASSISRLGAFSVDLRSGVRFWSEELSAIFDLAPGETPALEEAIGFYLPADQVRMRQAYERCARDGTPYDLELAAITRTGRHIWIRTISEAVRDADGKVIGIRGATQDITDRRAAAEAQRVSEERFRVIFEQAGIAIALVDARDGRILRGNAALATMLGYEIDELPELTVEQISETTEYAEDREQWERLVRGEIPRYQMAKRYYRKDGKVLWGFLTCTLIRDDAGRPRFLLGMVEDITKARAMQEALKQSEERLQLLVEATNDALYEWDLTTDALTWNDGFATQFGYARTAVEPTLAFFNARIHPDDLDRTNVEMRRALAGSVATWAGEYRFQRGDGSYAHVLDRGHILRDASGRAVRMVGGLTDLSDRKAAEERLMQQAALLDAAHDAILVKDLDDRITYWNKGAERAYGWMAHEVLGRRSAELFHVDRAIYAEANAALHTRGQWEGELIKRGRDGQDREVAVRWSLVRDPQGRPRSVFAIDADVTERKRLELQFLRAQRLESLGTLAGGIAHDLNNILAPILVSTELLRLDDPDPARLESIATIEASAKRGAAMVQQVLTFARGVEGKRLPLEPGRIVREVEKIARDTFPKDITIRREVGPEVRKIQADATQMHQILMNLAVNARDAMPKGGVLTLAIADAVVDEARARRHPDARPGRYVAFSVRDTGTGIPPAVLERLFEPFFTTKEVGKGTGLGLSTVHSIVRSHGGFIEVQSEPGEGAEFVVLLPASTEEQAAADAAIAAAPLPRGNGELILVVDDEASIRNIVQRMLERFGYRVLLAADGAEGLMRFREQRGAIAAVLTDMAMPVMDGPAMIAELVAADPGLRIIASSGLTSGGGVADALAAGVTDFVSKPYTAETLLTTLHRVLRESVLGP